MIVPLKNKNKLNCHAHQTLFGTYNTIGNTDVVCSFSKEMIKRFWFHQVADSKQHGLLSFLTPVRNILLKIFTS